MKVKLALLLTLIGTLPLAAQNVRQEQDTVSYMNDDPFNLEQIVVTATRTEKKIKNTPVITQIITSKQIEERGTGNIQDLLTQEVPGLNFQEVGYGTSIDITGIRFQTHPFPDRRRTYSGRKRWQHRLFANQSL